jgi:hypothetical protein
MSEYQTAQMVGPMPDTNSTHEAVAERIRAHLERERTTPTEIKELGQVPSSVDSLTPEWWSAVMCAGTPDAHVTAHTIVGGSKGTHVRHRHALVYDEAGMRAGLPAAVFTKTLPDLVTRMIGGYNGTARAEGRFYMQIRPALEIEAPRGYHAAFDHDTFAGINVMEDVAATKRANFCSHRTQVTRPMAEQMIDLLAALHAGTWEHPRFETDWRWVTGFADWFRVGSDKMETERYTHKALDRAGDLIPPDVLARRRDVWPATLAATPIHERAPRVLLHSDVHIGNWYQTAAGRMGLCDWQCVTRGHWSRDVSYMLAAGLTRADRRAWERALLARYLDRIETLAGVKLTVDAAWDDYRAQMMHAFWMWTITLCHSQLLPEMQPEDTTLEMVGRIATAMSDLESISAALA